MKSNGILPKCETKNCRFHSKPLWVYTNGKITIALCYACGLFEGMSGNKKQTLVLAHNPEMVLDLIHRGEFIPVN